MPWLCRTGYRQQRKDSPAQCQCHHFVECTRKSYECNMHHNFYGHNLLVVAQTKMLNLQ